MSSPWTLFNSHGLVLFYIAAHPNATMREMSAALDITQRRILEIVLDLSEGEMISINRVGRRNSYSINQQAVFRHPTLREITLGQLLLTTRPGTEATALPGA
jgi:hypothetical protein